MTQKLVASVSITALLLSLTLEPAGAAFARRGGAAMGPRGGAVVHRGGAYVGPRGGVAHRGTAVVGPRGNAVVHSRTVVRVAAGRAREIIIGGPVVQLPPVRRLVSSRRQQPPHGRCSARAKYVLVTTPIRRARPGSGMFARNTEGERGAGDDFHVSRRFIRGLVDRSRGTRAQTPDPLPSWNDGAPKKSITDFVARVTTPGAADFVPPPNSASPPSTTTARCGPSSRSISRSPLRSTASRLWRRSTRNGRPRSRSRPSSKAI